MLKYLIPIVAVAALSGCGLAKGVVGIRSGYEASTYTVVEKLNEKTEIRRYAPRLAAEVRMETEPGEKAGNDAFRVLFDYINGANTAQKKVSMTVPVELEEESQKVAMTVPVEQSADAGSETMMRFFLPSEFTMETAPEPKDERIKIVEVLGDTYAVYRRAGLMSTRDAESHRVTMLSLLTDTRWEVTGDMKLYYYDAPFTMPPFRRNEVLLPVTER